MQTIRQAVMWSSPGVLGAAVITIAALLLPATTEEVEPAAPVFVLPSVEQPVQTAWFEDRAREPAPPPPRVCKLAGRPISTTRVAAATTWFRELSSHDRAIASQICYHDHPCVGFMPEPNFERLPDDQRRDLDASIARDWQQSLTEIRWLVSRLPEIERGCARDYCAAMRPRYCNTPLVVAFDGEPIAYTVTGATFPFAPGEPVATDWPTATTPWIAIDLDHDGAITSGAELFGDSTRLPDGSVATNGYAALAVLDANNDDVIDAADPAFRSLLLWADRDADRASTPDELRPLSDIVTAIPLANRMTPRCDARGNCEGERGAVHWRDPMGRERVGSVVDVYLAHRR